jgi:CCR4-NOT transcription complex subunit 2
MPPQQPASKGPGSVHAMGLPNGATPSAYLSSNQPTAAKQNQAAQLGQQQQHLVQQQFPSTMQTSQLMSGVQSARSAHGLFDVSSGKLAGALSTGVVGQSTLPSTLQPSAHGLGSGSLVGLPEGLSENISNQLSGTVPSHDTAAPPLQRLGSEPGRSSETAAAPPQSQSPMSASHVGTGAQLLQDDGSLDAGASISDQHGMKGLLRVLKSGAGKTDLFLLTIGLDLTMLGLNLNSPDPLHHSFESPWDDDQTSSDVSCGNSAQGGTRAGEPDFKLPECYYMQPPALKTSHFAKFQLETLFYVFYNMPGDVLQLLAAIELYDREWRYHKDLKLWFTRAPGTAPGFERGAYIYFDISHWERRPFHDANQKFIQGLMTEDELRAARIPSQASGVSSA